MWQRAEKVAEDCRGDIEPWREQTAVEVAEGGKVDIGHYG
jgi:hypothetical protein